MIRYSLYKQIVLRVWPLWHLRPPRGMTTGNRETPFAAPT